VTEELLTPTPPAQPDPKFAVAPQERRRGALNRLLPVAGDESPDALPVLPHKAERIAMEEVKRGFIQYELPGPAAVAAKHEPEGDA
jgi:hypothetical protein